jgi:serine protease inhibitor
MTAMDMVYCGARNNTAKQMADLFKYKIKPNDVSSFQLVIPFQLASSLN